MISSRLWAFLNFLVYSIVLLIVPFGGLFWGIDALERDFESRHLESTVEELSQITAHLLRLAKVETRFAEVIRNILHAVSMGEPVIPIIKKEPEGSLAIFLFDEAGKRIKSDGFSNEYLRVSEKYFSLLQKFRNSPETKLNDSEKDMAGTFSGNFATLGILGNQPEQLHDLQNIGIKRLGGWFSANPKNGKKVTLLVWVDLKKISVRRLTEEAVVRLAKIAPSKFSFGWLDMEAPDKFPAFKESSLSPLTKKILLRDHLQPWFSYGNDIFHLANPSPEIRLFGKCKIPKTPREFQVFRGILISILTVILLLAIWKGYFEREFNFSIRTTLTIFFGVAGLVSVGALLGFANLYREARQEYLIRDNLQNSTKILEKIDNSFNSFFGGMIQEYFQLENQLASATGDASIKDIPSSEANTADILKKFCREQTRSWFYSAFYVGEDGKLQFKGSSAIVRKSRGWLKGDFEKTVENLGTQIISLYNFKPSMAVEAYTQQDSVLQKVLTKPSENILRKRGLLQTLNLAGEDSTNFVDLVLDGTGKAKGMLLIMHDTRLMEIEYVTQALNRQTGVEEFRMVALPKISNTGLPIFPSEVNSSQEDDLFRLSERITQTEVPHQRIGKMGGVVSMMTGIPGKNITDYNLFLVSPFGPIEKKSRELMMGFLLLAFFTVIFALLLGWLLAQNLLGPLGELGNGVERLVSMKFDKPVEINSGDDLELIGNGINQIMKDLKELALARTVQEHLLPSQSLVTAKYRCHGWSRSSGDFAGEVFDFFELPDGRLAILLGDLSGLGISSTLLIAMSKMAVRLFQDFCDGSPGKVLAELTKHFKENFRRIRKKAFFIGILNPNSLVLTYSSLGECYPFLVLPDKDVCLINLEMGTEDSQITLGASDEASITLKPSSRLVICSDGIFAYPGKSDDPSGTSHFKELLEETRNVPFENLGEWVFGLLDSVNPEEPCQGDQSILALETLSPAADEEAKV